MALYLNSKDNYIGVQSIKWEYHGWHYFISQYIFKHLFSSTHPQQLWNEDGGYEF